MLENQVARLRALTDAVAAGAGKRAGAVGGRGRGAGRYGRKPDFTALSVPGTRPRSDRGVTFHFKHSFVSKRNSVAAGYRDLTSAPAHQRYIERAGAAESVLGADGVVRETSFGNLGDSKEERADFWRKVERLESKSGRVQCRMIVELPHECSPVERERIARDFCHVLADRGFPHWCVIHAPDEHNDRRNYHMHVVYYDRPAKRVSDGRWDFEVATTGRWKNGARVTKYPLRQNKDRAAQGREWISQLRRAYAETANAVLAEAGAEKRYDPRPYRESRVAKRPTAHLGNKLAVAESQGIDTTLGRENARREIHFRLAAPDAAYARISGALDTAIRGLSRSADAPGSGVAAENAMQICAAYRSILSRSLGLAKRRQAHLVAAEAVTHRATRRGRFLDEEFARLTARPPRWLGEADALDLAFSLAEERRLVDGAVSDLSPFVATCRAGAERLDAELSALDARRAQAADLLLAQAPALRRILGSSEIAALSLPLALGDSSSDARTGFAPARGEALPDGLAETRHATRESPAPFAPETPATPTGPDRIQPAEPETSRCPTDRPATPPNPEVVPGDTAASAPPQEEADIGSGGRDPHTPEPEDRQDPAPAAPPLPGVLLFPADRPEAEISAELDAMENWRLRYHAFATRDAAEYTDDEANAALYLAAFTRIEAAAKRRGLDIETGRIDRDKAADRALAERHREEAIRDPLGLQRQRRIT